MKYILNKRIKYYTKSTFKVINLIAIALFIIVSITLVKYKLVCVVTISGEEIGYIQDKRSFEETVNSTVLMADNPNVAFTDIENMPEYSLKLVENTIETNEEEILEKIAEKIEVTYRVYAVTLDGKTKSIVDTLEDAEEVISTMKKEYGKNLELDLGIKELYQSDEKEYTVTTLAKATSKVSKELAKIEESTVNGVYFSETPVSGVITSRFGAVESIRDHTHMGIDIGAPYGVSIKAAADGKVTYSGWLGGYGNLVIISHGNGVETYYGHCSSLDVEKGDKVKAGDTIARVGSTGNSTGNHLHFEIRLDDEQVNPQSYVYK